MGVASWRLFLQEKDGRGRELEVVPTRKRRKEVASWRLFLQEKDGRVASWSSLLQEDGKRSRAGGCSYKKKTEEVASWSSLLQEEHINKT